jgi:hypothetical protein
MKISVAVPEWFHSNKWKDRRDETEADFPICCWSRAKNEMLVAGW